MSRIFDALRKSEKQLQEQPFVSPKQFLDAMEESQNTLPGIPLVRATLREDCRLIAHTARHSLGAERFRLLRTQLATLQGEREIKTIVVVSAVPQEGKTFVAANLATVLSAQEKKKVLLLEGDLRRGSLERVLSLSRAEGLSECLQSEADPMSYIRQVQPLGFYLMSSGRHPDSPVDLLQTQRFGEVLGRLRHSFDWVIVDAPPLGLIADSSILRQHADGVLVVARAGHTPQELVKGVVDEVGAESIVGIVLNGAEEIDSGYYGYGYYSSNGNGSTPKQVAKPGPAPKRTSKPKPDPAPVKKSKLAADEPPTAQARATEPRPVPEPVRTEAPDRKATQENEQEQGIAEFLRSRARKREKTQRP